LHLKVDPASRIRTGDIAVAAQLPTRQTRLQPRTLPG